MRFIPAAGCEQKNWPHDRWQSLLQRLIAETTCHFLLIGGEAEGDRLESLCQLAPPNRLALARNESLPALAQRMVGCSGFLGHDSGISHLAAAVGLSGYVLWGHTNRKVWSPLGGKMEILDHPIGLKGIDVDDVLEKVQELLVSP